MHCPGVHEPAAITIVMNEDVLPGAGAQLVVIVLAAGLSTPWQLII